MGFTVVLMHYIGTIQLVLNFPASIAQIVIGLTNQNMQTVWQCL
jgi:hypothetical protein